MKNNEKQKIINDLSSNSLQDLTSVLTTNSYYVHRSLPPTNKKAWGSVFASFCCCSTKKGLWNESTKGLLKCSKIAFNYLLTDSTKIKRPGHNIRMY